MDTLRSRVFAERISSERNSLQKWKSRWGGKGSDAAADEEAPVPAASPPSRVGKVYMGFYCTADDRVAAKVGAGYDASAVAASNKAYREATEMRRANEMKMFKGSIELTHEDNDDASLDAPHPLEPNRKSASPKAGDAKSESS